MNDDVAYITPGSDKYQFAKFVRGFLMKVNGLPHGQAIENTNNRKYRVLRMDPIRLWLQEFEDNPHVNKYFGYRRSCESIDDYFALIGNNEDFLFKTACRALRNFEKRLAKSDWQEITPDEWDRLNSYFGIERERYEPQG